jgi:hypothetical protein
MPPLGENIDGGGDLSVDFRQQRLFTMTTAAAQDPSGGGPTIVRKNTVVSCVSFWWGEGEERGRGDFVKLQRRRWGAWEG